MGVFYFNDYIINKANLISNIECVRARLKPNVKICAVVKANAYGVGVREVVQALKGRVDAFAVASVDEGIEVRKLDKKTKIIVLGSLNFERINDYQKYFLSPTVSTLLEIRKLSSEVKKPLEVEFGLDTGMHRIGFSKKSEIIDAILILNKNKKITISGAFSHLATKQNNRQFIKKQKQKFDKLLSAFNNENIIRHISNSFASWNENGLNYDMVRIGFLMYGMGDDYVGTRRVVEIVSRVTKLNLVKAGEFVGYDCTFKAKRESLIAVLPIGYYDGVSRRLSNKGRVIINGEYAPIVGRVCMDMMMVDVTNIKNVTVGTHAVVIGSMNEKEITIKEHADIVGTSEYEILARFNNSRMNIVVKE